jgi:hypothetical protein
VGGVQRAVDDRVREPHRVLVDSDEPLRDDRTGEERDPPVSLADHVKAGHESGREPLVQGVEGTQRCPAVRRWCGDGHLADDRRHDLSSISWFPVPTWRRLVTTLRQTLAERICHDVCTWGRMGR